MASHPSWKALLTGFVIVGLVVIAGNIGLYLMLSQEYDAKMEDLSAAMGSSIASLEQEISAERVYGEQQRLVLQQVLEDVREETEDLSGRLDTVSFDLSKVQSESRLGIREVRTQLEERSAELESQISNIDVSSSDFSSIIGDVTPAVVSVRTDFGQGSGVIFDSGGMVLTNRHVIEGADRILIVDHEGTGYFAELLGVASKADLAVLQILSEKSFHSLGFANPSEIRVGQRVIAVGNPLGLSLTVTEGIISATDRVIDSSGVGYVQTDVPINRGNSGGPLINAKGRIVGINTFKLLDTEGLGFAIPAEVAESIAEQAAR